MTNNARTWRASEATGVGGDRQHNCSTAAAAHTGRPVTGEVVAVHGLAGRFVVVSTSDPSLVTLENDRGVELRVGERQVVRLEGGAA